MAPSTVIVTEMDPAAVAEPTELAIDLCAVTLRRGTTTTLGPLSWQVRRGERWVVLGHNGSGKTSLARLITLYEHPTTGSTTVLGETLGRTDVRALRTRVGFVSAAFVDLVRPSLTCSDVVVCALNAALEPWWHTYSEEDRKHAAQCLEAVGLGEFAHRTFGSLSSGERQRVQLARALMVDPELLVLDEPCAGLDLAGREQLVADLDAMDGGRGRTLVLVTHHVEEIPTTFTNVLLLRQGEVVAAGPLESVLTSAHLSVSAGIDLSLDHRHGRWSAVAAPVQNRQ